MANPLATIAPERLEVLVNIFGKALRATPEDMTMADRALLALQNLPVDVAREIGDAAALLASLADEAIRNPG